MPAEQTLSKITSVDDLALTVVEAVRLEYPHRLHQQLNSDADLLPPRELNPSFFGGYDWHSAVHCHWALLRYLKAGCSPTTATKVITALEDHLTAENIAGELRFFQGESGLTSERPYGWAWLLLLEATCRSLGNDTLHAAKRWAQALEPLAGYLQARLVEYFSSLLALPIRSETHSNSAFSLHLCIQAATMNGNEAATQAFTAAALRFFGVDYHQRWDDEISGDAFLTPSLTAAALMAELLPEADFQAWLARFPAPTLRAWSVPSFSPDGNDPGTVHLEGVLISRTWAFEAILRSVPRHSNFAHNVRIARDAHLRRVHKIDPTDGFGRSHWLPSFLCYLEAWLQNSW
jgi:hypothetical protein